MRLAFALLAGLLAFSVVRFQFSGPSLQWPQIAALCVGVALGSWRLRYGIMALVFAAPLLKAVSRSEGVPDMSLGEHVFIALLFCAGLRMLRDRQRRERTAIDLPLAVFLAIATLSAAVSLGEYSATGMSSWDVVGQPLNHHYSYSIWDFGGGPFLIIHSTLVLLEGGLWFSLLTSPVAQLRAAHLRYALVSSAVLVGLLGLAQALSHVGLVTFFHTMQPNLLRLNSTLPDPNTFGCFVALLLPIGFVTALEQPHGRWWALGWGTLLGYCLVGSVSRSAWVGAIVAILALLGLVAFRPRVLAVEVSGRTKRWLRWGLGTTAIGLLGAVVVVSTGMAGEPIVYKEARSPLDMVLFSLDVRRSLTDLIPSRPEHWQAAILIWRDFPWFGAGIGKYPLLKGRFLPEARIRWLFFSDPHNYYLKILSELGVAGLLAFVGVLLGIGLEARKAWRAADRMGKRRVVALVTGLSTLLVASLAQDPLTLVEMQYVFWAVVGTLVLEGRESIHS